MTKTTDQQEREILQEEMSSNIKLILEQNTKLVTWLRKKEEEDKAKSNRAEFDKFKHQVLPLHS